MSRFEDSEWQRWLVEKLDGPEGAFKRVESIDQTVKWLLRGEENIRKEFALLRATVAQWRDDTQILRVHVERELATKLPREEFERYRSATDTRLDTLQSQQDRIAVRDTAVGLVSRVLDAVQSRQGVSGFVLGVLLVGGWALLWLLWKK